VLKLHRRKRYEEVKNSLSYGLSVSYLKYPDPFEDLYTFVDPVDKEEPSLSETEKKLLSYLFNRPGADEMKSLRVLNNHIRYFSDHLFGAIPFDRFDVYKNGGPDAFLKFIDQYSNLQTRQDLKELLLRLNLFTDKSSLFNFLKGFLRFCNSTD